MRVPFLAKARRERELFKTTNELTEFFKKIEESMEDDDDDLSKMIDEAFNSEVEDEGEDEENLLVTSKLDSLREEMEGISDTLDEIPAEIAKKWLKELNLISFEYSQAKQEFSRLLTGRQKDVFLKYFK